MASSTTQPLTSFTCFSSLPPELRHKIWHHSFYPRALEFHPIPTHHTEIPEGEVHAHWSLRPRATRYTSDPNEPIVWQSHCANHPALFACAESRREALRHYSVRYPTARSVAAGPVDPLVGEGQAGEEEGDNDKGKDKGVGFKRRPLYLNPEQDTIVPLGRMHREQIVALLHDIKRRDPQNRTPQRVGLDLANWMSQLARDLPNWLSRRVYGPVLDEEEGSGAAPKPKPKPLPFLSPELLKDMSHLTLLMFNEVGPPPAFWNGECVLEDSTNWDPIWLVLFKDNQEERKRVDGWVVIDGLRMAVKDLGFVMGGVGRGKGMDEVEGMEADIMKGDEGQEEWGPSNWTQVTRRERRGSC
ncbi:hypothetical protein SLS62_009335 [Diatrype stigma]|uniref:2EXR domain-containing protein n=1 Tax=Diatrype stigma TaxID=117547 RepID=A0AAN9YKZ7_9PEZI